MNKEEEIQKFKNHLGEEAQRLGLHGYAYFVEDTNDGSYRTHVVEMRFKVVNKLYLSRLLQMEADTSVAAELNARAVPFNFGDQPL